MAAKVLGKILDSVGNPVKNAVVVIWDYDKTSPNDFMGKGITNNNGDFVIGYNFKSWDPGIIPFKNANPDIFATVYCKDQNGKWVLNAKSNIFYNHMMTKDLRINLTVNLNTPTHTEPKYTITSPKVLPSATSRDLPFDLLNSISNVNEKLAVQKVFSELLRMIPYSFLIYIENSVNYYINDVMIQLFDKMPEGCPDYPCSNSGRLFYYELVNLQDLVDRQVKVFEYRFIIKYTDVSSGDKKSLITETYKMELATQEAFLFPISLNTTEPIVTNTSPLTTFVRVSSGSEMKVFLCSHYKDTIEISKIERLDNNNWFEILNLPSLPSYMIFGECCYRADSNLCDYFTVKGKSPHEVQTTEIKIYLKKDNVDDTPIIVKFRISPAL